MESKAPPSSLSADARDMRTFFLKVSTRRPQRPVYLCKDAESARRELRGAAFRGISNPVEKAALLVISGVCSLRIAAAAVTTSAGAEVLVGRVRRAVDAVLKGRPIGQAWRPSALSVDAEERLWKWLIELWDNGTNPTVAQTTQKGAHEYLSLTPIRFFLDTNNLTLFCVALPKQLHCAKRRLLTLSMCRRCIQLFSLE